MTTPKDRPVQAATYGKEWIESAWGRLGDAHADAMRPRPRVARALQLMQLAPGLRVLDIACGRGEVPAFVRNAGGWSVGLDFSRDVLAIARELRDTGGAPQGAMHLVEGDAARLPFADGSFDRVAMLDIVEHLTPGQLAAMFADVRRVLAPGGYAVIHTLPNRWVYELAYPAVRWLWRGLPRQPRSAVEQSVHINEQDIGSLADVLAGAGLGARIWLEQLMPAQARWGARAGGFRDQRDKLYPRLAGWLGRVLEWLSLTPARLVLANDIFAIAWRDDAPAPQARVPLRLTEQLVLALRPRREQQGGGDPRQ